MVTVILVIHVLIAIGLVAVILMQRSEGGALGIGGGGAGGGLISSRAAGNLLTRVTAVLAAVFMVTSLTLAIIANNSREPASSILDVAPAASEAAPVEAAPVPETEAPAPAPEAGPVVPLSK